MKKLQQFQKSAKTYGSPSNNFFLFKENLANINLLKNVSFNRIIYEEYDEILSYDEENIIEKRILPQHIFKTPQHIFKNFGTHSHYRTHETLKHIFFFHMKMYFTTHPKLLEKIELFDLTAH